MLTEKELILDISDEDIVERLQSGDMDAFSQLVSRYEKPLLNFLYRFLGDYHLAEDIFQETFITIYRKSHKFDLSKKFSTWLYHIATNKAVDRLRKRKNLMVIGSEIENLEYNQETTEENYGKKEEQVNLHKALASLPEEHRLVVVLKHYQGLDYSQIAEVLGCPVGTVKSRMYYALKSLKSILETDKL